MSSLSSLLTVWKKCKALVSSAGFKTYRNGFTPARSENLSASFLKVPSRMSQLRHKPVGLQTSITVGIGVQSESEYAGNMSQLS